MGHPKHSSNWYQDATAYVHAASTINCILPPKVQLVWEQRTLNNHTHTLIERSAALNFNNVSKNHSGAYRYQVLNTDNNSVMFASFETPTFYVSCESFQHIRSVIS